MDSSSVLASVIIPTFNRKSFLAGVVTPLLSDSGTGEIIVVIDGSTDGTLELLTKWATTEPKIRPIFQNNAGELRARRRGIEEARFNVVVLLDDDVVAAPGLISGHAHWHIEQPRRLVLGYMPAPLRHPRRPGQVTTALYCEDYEKTCIMYETDSSSVFSHFWAGNVSLRRETALEVETAQVVQLRYHGDLQFGLRCRDSGLEPIFDRSLLASHSHSKSLRKFANECRHSGEARAQLSRQYPELAVELNPLDGLSRRVTAIARKLNKPLIHLISTPVMVAVCFGSGRLHAWWLENISARALRVMELSFGFTTSTHRSGD